MPRVMPRASITSSTGRPSCAASAALLLLPSSARPSYRPLLPSTRHEVGAARRARAKQRVDLGVVHQQRVEVEAGPAGGQRQPHRVDVVRALLERLHALAARGQRGGQAERHASSCPTTCARRRRAGGCVIASLLAPRPAKSSCGRKSSTRTPISGQHEGGAQAADAEQPLGPARRVELDRAVGEAAASPRGRGRSPAGTPARR